MSKKHKPQGDTTQARRQARRVAQLQAAAERDGFNNWSEALTAWKNGAFVLTRKIEDTPLQEQLDRIEELIRRAHYRDHDPKAEKHYRKIADELRARLAHDEAQKEMRK